MEGPQHVPNSIRDAPLVVYPELSAIRENRDAKHMFPMKVKVLRHVRSKDWFFLPSWVIHCCVELHVQGWAKVRLPGSVKMRRESCVPLPAGGRRTQLLTLFSQNLVTIL